MSRSLSKYLARHAEPEAALAEKVAGTFGHALIIPAYNERESLFRLLASVPGGPAGPVLIVVVVNAREDSPASVRAANGETLARFGRDLGAPEKLSDSPQALVYELPGGKLLVLDRSSPGAYLPEGQGVGLARKIGNDVVLRLWALERLASPWLHNTDADVLLPKDYFEQTVPIDAETTAAAVYSYEHRFEEEPDLAQAGRLYEISLRYDVLGLDWAGSPYAYQSMGSCLAIPGGAYASVRGFPRKDAAEDFYALDKLAKVGAIQRISGSPLLLEGRPSDRVPFGTGRALRDLTGGRRSLAHFRLDHPLAYAHLAAWLRVLDRLADSDGGADRALAELPSGNPFFRSDLLREALEKMQVAPAIAQAREKSADPETMRRHLHTWFDAFRTRKLLHAMRAGLPPLPWREALAEAPFTELSASTADEVEELRRALSVEERHLAARRVGLPQNGKPIET